MGWRSRGSGAGGDERPLVLRGLGGWGAVSPCGPAPGLAARCGRSAGLDPAAAVTPDFWMDVASFVLLRWGVGGDLLAVVVGSAGVHTCCRVCLRPAACPTAVGQAGARVLPPTRVGPLARRLLCVGCVVCVYGCGCVAGARFPAERPPLVNFPPFLCVWVGGYDDVCRGAVVSSFLCAARCQGGRTPARSLPALTPPPAAPLRLVLAPSPPLHASTGHPSVARPVEGWATYGAPAAPPHGGAAADRGCGTSTPWRRGRCCVCGRWRRRRQCAADGQVGGGGHRTRRPPGARARS